MKIGNLQRVKGLAFVILILVSTYVLYNKSFSYFFLQDDWFHLNISKAANVREFINFFAIRTDIIAWRPISKQLFFFVSQVLFGLNPLGPHLIIYTFFISNVFLVYRLVLKLSANYRVAAITGFLYGTSTIHFTPLSWLSAGEYIIGTFFWILCMLTYLSFKEKGEVSFYLLFITFFVLCLASTEFALTIPLIIIGYEIFLTINNSRMKVQALFNPLIKLLPILTIIFCYLLFRLVVYPIPTKGDYSLSFNLQIANTFLWYCLWSLNVPEIFKSHIIFSKFTLTKDLAEVLKIYSTPLSIAFLLFFSTVCYAFFKNLSYKTMKLFFLSLSFLFICLWPVLFLPKHTFAHYLSIPSIGVYAFISYLLERLLIKNKIYTTLFIISLASWFFLSVTSLTFTRKTSWIPDEEKASKDIFKKLNILPKQDKSKLRVIIYPSTLKTRQSLMDQYALQVIFDDNRAKTIYEVSKPLIQEKDFSYLEIQ